MQVGDKVSYSGFVSRMTGKVVEAGGSGTVVGFRPTYRWEDDAIVLLEDGRRLCVPLSSLSPVPLTQRSG